MIPVYIPSMARADARVLKGPIPQLLEVGAPVYVVVPEEELFEYGAAMRTHGLEKANILPTVTRGIAAVRHWIGHHAEATGNDKFIMMDDDIAFLVRRGEDTWRLRGTTPQEVGEMLVWTEDMLDVYQHVGISAREGNNRPGVGSVSSLVDFNSRTIRFLAYQTDAFMAVEHGRVKVMEDFDVNLQILERGGDSAMSYWWAQGQRMTNEPGGCSTYRSHQVHEESARKLAELHPGIVSLRQKKNKTDADGFGTRTEVTIQWKKAAKQGKQSVK